MKNRHFIALTLTLACTPIGQASAANASSTSPSPAAPTSWTVFGLPLGEPLSIPLCKHRLLPDGTVMDRLYEENPAQTCYEPDIQLRDAPWRRGSVDFPLAKAPLILHENGGLTLMVDGKLEGLRFDTLSYGNTEGIIDELRKKFGPPTSVTHITATPNGVPIPAIDAEWQLPNLYVSYINIKNSVEYGFLEIRTPTMQRLEKALDKSREEQRTAL